MIPIAHRGLWWPHQAHQNSVDAAKAAAQSGYGVELDACLVDGVCRIQHYPPQLERSPNGPAPRAYLQGTVHTDCLFFWDIKTDGLHDVLLDELATWNVLHRSVIFDQDFLYPDAGFLNFNRHSGEDFKSRCPDLIVCGRAENQSSLLDILNLPWTDAVWMDTMDGDWVTSREIKLVHDAGKKAFIVSPELHGRALDLTYWKEWNLADGIATDFPHLLDRLIIVPEDRNLYPKEAWW